MGYTPVAVSEFGGYDPTSSPDQSGCVDILNIDFDVRGAIRQRDGYDNHTSSTTAVGQLFPFTKTDLTAQVLLGRGATVQAISSAGTVVATANRSNAFSFARFGSPTVEYVYIGGSDTGQIQRWDGTNFTSPAGLNGAAQFYRYLGVQSPDNRLVGAFLNAATPKPSEVGFSNAGAAETWTATDTVQITPGDGEVIAGVCSWRDLLFVWKQTKFAVFYGNSTDSTGGAVFNFRTVDGQGIISGGSSMARQQWAVAPEGVYFVNSEGVWLTTGGPPTKVSHVLDAYFTNDLNTNLALAYRNNRLYVTVADTSVGVSNNRVLVWDRPTDTWTRWDLAAYTLCPSPFNTTDLLFVGSTSTEHVYKQGPAYTDDNGSAIASHYQTGWRDLGYPAQEKDIARTRMWGTGTIGTSGARDFGSVDTATSVTLGTSPAIAAGLHNKQKKGELISYKFASVSGGAWTLHRYAHMLRGAPRPPGERSD